MVKGLATTTRGKSKRLKSLLDSFVLTKPPSGVESAQAARAADREKQFFCECGDGFFTRWALTKHVQRAKTSKKQPGVCATGLKPGPSAKVKGIKSDYWSKKQYNSNWRLTRRHEYRRTVVGKQYVDVGGDN